MMFGKIRSFLTLIRLHHLLVIAFAQYMMRYGVVQPLIRLYGFELQMSHQTFFWLVMATVLTAAAGHAINNYFDVRTDTINRPGSVVVGKSISRRGAMLTHILLCVSGILIGGYVTWRAGVPKLAVLFILAATVLWLYPFIYKRQFLTGNLMIALLTALIPLSVLLDIPLLNVTYREQLLDAHNNLNLVSAWVLCFAVFTFLAALSRSIIKDNEDFEGDSAYGCRSIIIVLGVKAAKRTIIGINALMTIALGVAFRLFLNHNLGGQFDYLTFFHFLLLLVAPLFWTCFKVYRAKTADDYRLTASWMTWVMIGGITYGAVVYYNLTYF
ncbi:MAG: geranylgeranylglycerol-phosphate geranylgeranyltransferase [Bacteroidales bacterium]|jgi:4-hydroxybenzoate polyprenyltransferase|nr:geranylgeranylglycerol-phosphate geranylgeranyltransferase [Bacteroidales bacterium]